MATEKRQIILLGDIAHVPLADGNIAVIDAVDVPLVDRWSWSTDRSRPKRYVRATIQRGGVKRHVAMHRLILGLSDPAVSVDHIDGNPLNNRRSNLRLATNAENSRNQKLKPNLSGFKGVTIQIRRRKNGTRKSPRWRCRVKVDGVYRQFGTYVSAEDAARAYDHHATILHGEFALTNAMMGLL